MHSKMHGQHKQDFLQVESNQEQVLRLFRSYFRSHQTAGKLFDDFPDFFLVKPIVLKDPELVERASDRLIVDDCVQRAQQRHGYVGVSKWRNPKLNYYWLELSVFPFVLGDEVTQNNEWAFYYVLQQFIDFTRQHPRQYGDMAEGAEVDHDLKLMLAGIAKHAGKIKAHLAHYPLDKLLTFNPVWPLAEVNKLLQTLKGSDLDWCELFFEHIIYAMGQKHQGEG
ncbi:MAG: hypothetical protein AB1722_02945 [Pseudomonadota bacterium]